MISVAHFFQFLFFVINAILLNGMVWANDDRLISGESVVSSYSTMPTDSEKFPSLFDKQEKIKFLLATMPLEDKKSLESFFRKGILFESFGYVVFGNKPMVLGVFYTKKSCINIRSSKIFFYDSMWDDYLVWKKYQHLFPITNYTLRVWQSPVDDNWYDFLFINTNKVIETIDEHISIFQEKLGSLITSKDILDQLEKNDNILEEVFKDQNDLLGILLGFGKHNSYLYQKRENIENEYHHPPYDLKKILQVNEVKLSSFPLESSIPFNFIDLPYFVEDNNNQESIEIRKKYLETQKLLCEIYSKGDFLEITLNALL